MVYSRLAEEYNLSKILVKVVNFYTTLHHWKLVDQFYTWTYFKMFPCWFILVGLFCVIVAICNFYLFFSLYLKLLTFLFYVFYFKNVLMRIKMKTINSFQFNSIHSHLKALFALPLETTTLLLPFLSSLFIFSTLQRYISRLEEHLGSIF